MALARVCGSSRDTHTTIHEHHPVPSLSRWSLQPCLRKLAKIPCCCFLRACVHEKTEAHHDELGNPPFSGL